MGVFNWGYFQKTLLLEPKMPLTDTAIKKVKPGDKPVKLSDGKGMYLLVNSTGSKLWRWKYRVLGKEKVMSLGAYPDVSLAQARDGVDKARKVLAAGDDPMAIRKAGKVATRSRSACAPFTGGKGDCNCPGQDRRREEARRRIALGCAVGQGNASRARRGEHQPERSAAGAL